MIHVISNPSKGLIVVIDPRPYNRKSNPILAIQVTEENMEDVAVWCEGEVYIPSNPEGREAGICVKFPNKLHPVNPFRAKPGDYVIKEGRVFRAISQNSLRTHFVPANVRTRRVIAEQLVEGDWFQLGDDMYEVTLNDRADETIEDGEQRLIYFKRADGESDREHALIIHRKTKIKIFLSKEHFEAHVLRGV